MSEMSEQCGTSETSSDNETAKLPLVHTVSFYRRQTQQVQRIIRQFFGYQLTCINVLIY